MSILDCFQKERRSKINKYIYFFEIRELVFSLSLIIHWLFFKCLLAMFQTVCWQCLFSVFFIFVIILIFTHLVVVIKSVVRGGI